MPENMGKKVNELRTSLDMTLAELGDKVGVGASTVRKWETGMIKNIQSDKIQNLAEALKISPAYLMGWEDTPNLDKTKAAGIFVELSIEDVGTKFPQLVEVLLKENNVISSTKTLSLEEAYQYYLVSGFSLPDEVENAILKKIPAQAKSHIRSIARAKNNDVALTLEEEEKVSDYIKFLLSQRDGE